MDAPASALSARAPPPAAAGPCLRSALCSLRGEDLYALIFQVVVVAVLAAAGYPAWRFGLVAFAGLGAQVGSAVRRRKVEARRCLNADLDRRAWRIVLSHVPQLLASGLAVGVTGGVGSPLLVMLVTAWVSAATIVGDRLQTRLLLGATALGACLLGLLPAAAVGPPLPGGVHAILTGVSVAGLGALLVPVHALAWRKHQDLQRLRSEVASDALARAESLEQIGSRLAHELKNPLTGVKALVQLGLRNGAEASSHARLELVDREVLRMQEILQNYLSFTRPLLGILPRQVQLGPLVSDTLLVLTARADGARVRLYTQGDAPIEADPSRLKEALLNLVANAIEATPPGGAVAVEVEARGDEVEIAVRDTGRGMAAETLRRLGTPFFTTREGGTGLGVVLARAVIAQHGGSMRYESELGRGTRVQVRLPRCALPETRSGPAGEPLEVGAAEGELVGGRGDPCAARG